jgi:PAS domain S-box-containing protein
MLKTWFRNLPLKGKLVGLVLVSIFIALLAGYGVLLVTSVNQLRQEMLLSSRYVTNVVADFAVAPLSFNDQRGALEVVRHFDIVPDVQGVVLYDLQDEKIFQYVKEGVEIPEFKIREVQEGFFGGRLLTISPILVRDQAFGTMLVVSSTESLDARVLNLIVLISSVFILMLVVGLFFALRLQKVVSQPIIELTDVTRGIGLEGSPEVLSISHEADDEIKELYEAFDNMLRRIGEESQKRDKAQQALAASESRFRGMVQDQTECISRFSSNGTISFVNKAFCLLVGKPEKEILGESLFNWIHPDDLHFLRCQLDELSSDNPVVTSIIRVQTARDNLEERVVEWTTRAVFRSSNVLEEFQGVGRDMTELRRAQDAKRRIESQLQHSQRLETIGTLAGGIAHDFNNILTPVRGYIDLLIRETDPEDPRYKRVMRIGEAVSRARELIDQILTFGRKVEPKKSAVSLGDLVGSVLSFIRSTVSKNIEIRTEIPSERAMVFADDSQLHQTLMNLCTNACHAMGEKGGQLKVVVRHVTLAQNELPPAFKLKEGQYVELLVSDTGEGMEQQVLERIFEPFFTTKKVGEGTGLGLSVVHGIIVDHLGSITVESEVGKGTTFRVLLPKGEEGHEALKEHRAKIASAGAGEILLVDDEPMIVEMTCDMLELIGYKVFSAFSAGEAFEEFQKNPWKYDLLLTDQTMPGITGIELARKTRELRPDLPVIVSTGYSAESIDSMKMREVGIVACLRKPFDFEELTDIVARAIVGASATTGESKQKRVSTTSDDEASESDFDSGSSSSNVVNGGEKGV